MEYQGYRAQKTIYKDSQYKKLSGVCAGLARHFALPRFGVRVCAIISLFVFPVVTGVAYVVASLLLSNSPK